MSHGYFFLVLPRAVSNRLGAAEGLFGCASLDRAFRGAGTIDFLPRVDPFTASPVLASVAGSFDAFVVAVCSVLSCTFFERALRLDDICTAFSAAACVAFAGASAGFFGASALAGFTALSLVLITPFLTSSILALISRMEVCWTCGRLIFTAGGAHSSVRGLKNWQFSVGFE